MQKKKKVLIVVHQLNYGGVQKSLIPALNAIDYNRNEVTLYIRKNRTQLLPEVNENVNKIVINTDKTRYYRKMYMVYLEICKRLGNIIKATRWVEKLQIKETIYHNACQMKYEKEHYFTGKTVYDIAISYIQGYTAEFVNKCVKARKKIVFYHGSVDEKHELHEKILPQYDAIVGVNEGVKELLSEIYPNCAEKITVLENCIEAESIVEKSKAFVPYEKENLILCSCGRLSPEKGFDLAVKTASLLKQKGMEFKWYFVGDGVQREQLQYLIKEEGLEEQIVITGMVDNPYPYIKHCDIYIEPSYEESYGLTIAEAKVLCRPIVSTETVGAKKQICHMRNGILTAMTEEDLQDGILKYIEDDAFTNNVKDNLKQIDYAEFFRKYQAKWKELLKD